MYNGHEGLACVVMVLAGDGPSVGVRGSDGWSVSGLLRIRPFSQDTLFLMCIHVLSWCSGRFSVADIKARVLAEAKELAEEVSGVDAMSCQLVSHALFC